MATDTVRFILSASKVLCWEHAADIGIASRATERTVLVLGKTYHTEAVRLRGLHAIAISTTTRNNRNYFETSVT